MCAMGRSLATVSSTVEVRKALHDSTNVARADDTCHIQQTLRDLASLAGIVKPYMNMHVAAREVARLVDISDITDFTTRCSAIANPCYNSANSVM